VEILVLEACVSVECSMGGPFTIKRGSHQPGIYLAYLYYGVHHILGFFEVSLRVASVEAELPDVFRSSSVGERVLLGIAFAQLPWWLEHDGRVLCCGGRSGRDDGGGRGGCY